MEITILTVMIYFLNFFDKQTLVKNNIYYTDQQNKLFADIIEIDLMTKISKVYMLEKQKNTSGN